MNEITTVSQIEAVKGQRHYSEDARRLIKNSRADATRRAYNVQFDKYTGWCQEIGRPALPASAETIVEYIAYMREDGYSVSSLEQAMAALTLAHRAAHVSDTAFRDAEVRAAMKGARVEIGIAPHKKAAVKVEALRRMIAALDRSTLAGKRDAALLLLGFSGAFRRSELVALNIDDLAADVDANGMKSYAVTIRRSKTDREGAGLYKAITSTKSREMNPVIALDEWIAAAGIKDGAIFRRIRRGDNLSSERLGGRSVALIVKEAAAAADITLDVAAHSLRSGFITTCAEQGTAERLIMNQSGHKSVAVMRGYIQRANVFKDNAVNKLAEIM